MKKIIAALLAGTLILTACGSTPAASAPPEETKEETAETAVTESAEETVGKLSELETPAVEKAGYVNPFEGTEKREPAEVKSLPVEEETEPFEDLDKLELTGDEITGTEVSGKQRLLISASSTLWENGQDHSPQRVMDGYYDTAWVEGVTGYGVGEYLRFDFPRGSHIRAIDIMPGYHKSESLFWNNSAPTEVIVGSGDDVYLLSFYPDYGYYYQFDLGPGIVSDGAVYVIINAVRPGAKYKDTCISEIAFWGRFFE